MTVDAPEGAVPTAIADLERLERLWSRFLPDSDVSRVNLSAGFPTAVSTETVTLVQTMLEAYRLTEGRYDPTILRALVAHGYGTSRVDATRQTSLLPEVAQPGMLADMVVDPLGETVTLPAGLALDPGGIGKGLAADLVVAALLERGAAGAMVSIGGDLAMAGESPQQEGWVVEVEHADPADGVLCRLAVSGGGVATSSTVSRRWVADGVVYHHLIDPRTGGQSDTDLLAVTVIGRSGWSAEVHATACLLSGSSDAVAYLEVHGLSGLAIAGTGQVLMTHDLVGLNLEGSS
ncbi:unannotated protein [freshwater metagenome]|uniref:FAD:protein FMN transferase n=1 Tax=freshwater metagenome TaxID=449393 RepID=A0A6J6A2P9_9ZZZZ